MPLEFARWTHVQTMQRVNEAKQQEKEARAEKKQERLEVRMNKQHIANRNLTYFGPDDPSLVSKTQLSPLPLEFLRWTHVQEEEIRIEQELKRFELMNERHIANRCHTYFGSEDHGEADQIALEARRREFKAKSDEKALREAEIQAYMDAEYAKQLVKQMKALRQSQKAAKAAEKLARQLQSDAEDARWRVVVQQQLQEYLRQFPLDSQAQLDPAVDKRPFREDVSDVQVTVFLLTPEEIKAGTPSISDWKQHRIAIRDPLTNMKEDDAPPTKGPLLHNKPGIYELAVKPLGGQLKAVYLGYTTNRILARLSSAGFEPIERWIREQDQFEKMIYVRELIIEPPASEPAVTESRKDGHKKTKPVSFQAQLRKRKDGALNRVNYFVNPFGQVREAELRKLFPGIREDTLRTMYAAFIEFANWSKEDRTTSRRRATLLGESWEPEPMEEPEGAQQEATAVRKTAKVRASKPKKQPKRRRTSIGEAEAEGADRKLVATEVDADAPRSDPNAEQPADRKQQDLESTADASSMLL